ncbi:MAG TPA: hypothetical protein VGC79_36515, partial [Polyangiaceae bacterium]
MQTLTPWTKLMLAIIAAGSTFGAVHTYGKGSPRAAVAAKASQASGPSRAALATASGSAPI